MENEEVSARRGGPGERPWTGTGVNESSGKQMDHDRREPQGARETQSIGGESGLSQVEVS